jgi:2,3-bisphosphoglycerate-independent phosphoglycerate mutase
LVHTFTDGRDTDPKSGLGYLTDLQQHLNNTVGAIATVTGRYYAMDRDKRWERVKLAYDALVNAVGEKTDDVLKAVETSYANEITDEFLKPVINTKVENTKIQDGDAVICFNFRTDRCREITQVLTQQDMPEFGMQQLNLHYTTMTEYDKTYKNVNVIFATDNLTKTLGEVLEQHGRTQIRIAETEKYPHYDSFTQSGYVRSATRNECSGSNRCHCTGNTG